MPDNGPSTTTSNKLMFRGSWQVFCSIVQEHVIQQTRVQLITFPQRKCTTQWRSNVRFLYPGFLSGVKLCNYDGAWVHPMFLVGSVLLIFLVFCVVVCFCVCFVCLRLVHLMLPVSLDRPFLIAPSVCFLYLVLVRHLLWPIKPA